MNRRTLFIYGTLAIIALAAACVAFGAVLRENGRVQISDIGSGTTNETVGEQPTPVEVVTVVHRPLTRTLQIPATLQAYEKADLYAKISGYITQVSANIGNRVRQGDVLLEIAVPETADQLRRAEAVLESKRAREKLDEVTTRRKQQLAQEKAISQQELDEAVGQLAIARADTKVAESEVALLKTLLKYATVTAPFDGLITARNFDPGAFVRSAAEGQTLPLFSLARTDKIRLVIHVPEPDTPLVRVGTKVDITIQCLDGERIESAVARTSIALDSDTGTMRAEVDLDNTSGQLAPGMYAQVVVQLQTKGNALLLPSKAIRVRGGDISVLVVRNNVVTSVPVVIGYDDGVWVEIVGGQLTDEDLIITSAGSSVAPGALAEPVRQVSHTLNGDDNG